MLAISQNTSKYNLSSVREEIVATAWERFIYIYLHRQIANQWLARAYDPASGSKFNKFGENTQSRDNGKRLAKYIALLYGTSR